MSNTTTSSPRSSPTGLRWVGGTAIRGVGRIFSGTVRAIAFWTSVLLPILLLLAVLSGIALEHSIAFVGLIGANAVCAILGHEHTP